MSATTDDIGSDQDDAASRVCLSCGACCRGMLHTFAYLEDEEGGLATDLELRVIEVDGEPGFRLPCHHLGASNECRTFHRRPAACPDYRCGILEELYAGTLTESRALAFVGQIVELERKIYQHIGARQPEKTIWRQFRAYGEQEQARTSHQAFLANNAQALLSLKSLTVLCHRLQPSNFSNAPRPGST